VESIKRARKGQGMSLNELAAKTGLLRPTLARAERIGIDPRASTVATIARSLGVPVCELFDENGHGQRKTKEDQER
jgi:transcriptional regulator with XRE-family HTH domain